MESNKSIRLRTTPGLSQNIQVKIEQDFEYYIEKWVVEVLGGTYKLDPTVPASDIFEFIWEGLEIEYLRKN